MILVNIDCLLAVRIHIFKDSSFSLVVNSPFVRIAVHLSTRNGFSITVKYRNIFVFRILNRQAVSNTAGSISSENEDYVLTIKANFAVICGG